MAAPAWLADRPIAHRGYHDAGAGRIENGAAAAEAAIARRFAIEVDLRATADGQVAVFHDATLARLCGRPERVDALTLAEVTAARFRDRQDGPPSLDALLELVAGRVPLFLELKTDGRRDRRLERAVIRRLAAYPGPAAVMSFDPLAMLHFARHAPSVPRGLVADGHGHGASGAWQRLAFRHLIAAPFVRPHFIAYDVAGLPAPAPALLRRVFGRPVLAWTVRSPAARAVAAAHADQIIFEGFDPDAGETREAT